MVHAQLDLAGGGPPSPAVEHHAVRTGGLDHGGGPLCDEVVQVDGRAGEADRRGPLHRTRAGDAGFDQLLHLALLEHALEQAERLCLVSQGHHERGQVLQLPQACGASLVHAQRSLGGSVGGLTRYISGGLSCTPGPLGGLVSTFRCLGQLHLVIGP